MGKSRLCGRQLSRKDAALCAFSRSQVGVIGHLELGYPRTDFDSKSQFPDPSTTNSTSRPPQKIDKSHIAGRHHGGECHSVESSESVGAESLWDRGRKARSKVLDGTSRVWMMLPCPGGIAAFQAKHTHNAHPKPRTLSTG